MMHALFPVLLALLTPQEPDLGKLVSDAKLTMPQAIALALRTARTGTATQAELEFEKDRTVWSIDVAQGNKILEVLLDAKDGSVVETGEEAEDCSALVKAADLTLTEAVAAVLKGHQGVAVLAQLKLVDGKPQVTVDVLDRGKKATFLADVGEAPKGPEKQAGVNPKPAVQKGREEPQEDEAGEQERTTKTAAAIRPQSDSPFTDAFGEDDRDLGPTGTNPFFVLQPGYTLVLEGKEEGVDTRIVIKVLAETRMIGGIEARVVEERETSGGELKEVTRDYFAISRRTNNVYYLGEDVDDYQDGVVKGHAGSWRHGKDGASYGLMMPGTPMLGARYQQEKAPGVAMDRAEIEGLAGTFQCPAGRFQGVLVIKESTPLEPGSEHKLYARGVGLLQDGGLRLVRYGQEPKAK